jgi:hypothetical protein
MAAHGIYLSPLTTVGDGDAGGGGVGPSAGNLINDGTVTGGTGGAAGTGGGDGGHGGYGIDLAASLLINIGNITGGDGGIGPYIGRYNGGTGGTGAILASGMLINGGTIRGGIGGNVVNHNTIHGGDAGFRFMGSGPPGGDDGTLAAGSLTNYGMISGGRAGSGHTYDLPGGAGATISGGMLTNHGTIVGGTRIETLPDFREAAGSDVDISAGSLINDGTITGGYGGAGKGGVGVYFHNGGTLTNDGLISRSAIYSISQATADAVDFGNDASRLVLGNDGDFLGAVVAYNTVLELSSSDSAGTVTSLGDTVSGFQTVTIDPGAAWFISGTGLAAGQTIDGFTMHDTIELTGITVTGSSYVGGDLTLASAGGPVMLDLPGDFTTGDFNVHNAAGVASPSCVSGPVRA